MVLWCLLSVTQTGMFLVVVEPRQGLLQDLAIEEEQRAQRLVLRGAATLRWMARSLRKRVIAAAPISAGWRLPWKKM